MAYISKENLNLELRERLKDIENLKNNPVGISVIESSFDIVIQNKDLSFTPSSILINNYIQYEFGNRVPTNAEFKIYYMLSAGGGRWFEYNSMQLIPPSSVFINFDNFPPDQVQLIKYIRIDTVNDGVIAQSKTIPFVKDGLDGDKGDSFTYEDFTHSQLESLRGERGMQGIQGEKGEIGDVNIVHYNANGETPYKVKIFTGETRIVSDGVWTIDYSHVGFSKVLGVYGNALQPSTSAGDTATGVTVSSFNNNGASGKALKGTSAGLLAAMSSLWLTDINAKIQVLVIGY